MSSKNGVSPAFARDADDALRVQLEPSFLDRARDAAHPLHLAMPVGAVVAFVDLHAVAAAVLGRVTGDVGGRQHRRARCVVSRAMRTTPMLAPTDRLLAPHRKR